MARIFAFEDITSREPIPKGDVLRLAGGISKLPAFANGAAVICGSVAWGEPSWRSDIDIAVFNSKSTVDLSRSITKLVKAYDKSTIRRYVLPKVDLAIVGSESEKTVIREDLTGGSSPITEKQTVREYVEVTRLQFSDHVGSLAAKKGDPWKRFYKTYLAGADGGHETRRAVIRGYVTSFVETWRQQPLRGSNADPSDPLKDDQLDALGHLENFPAHLMRQIMAEIGRYPKPDRGSDVQAAFDELPQKWVGALTETLRPFLQINEQYLALVVASRDVDGQMSAPQYYARLREIVEPLPFSEIEDAVWKYLDA